MSTVIILLTILDFSSDQCEFSMSHTADSLAGQPLSKRRKGLVTLASWTCAYWSRNFMDR